MSAQLLLIAAIVVCLGLSFFFSGSETAVISVNRYRLRGLHEDGDREAGRLLKLLDNTQRILIMVLIGSNLANVLTALFFKSLVEQAFPVSGGSALGLIVWSDVASLLILTPMVVMFAEILPKTLFRAHADRLALSLRPAFVMCLWILSPAIWLVEKFARLMLGPLTEARSRAVRRLTRQDVLQLVKPGERPEDDEDGQEAKPAKQDATKPESAAKPSGRQPKGQVAPGIKAKVERAFEASDERRMVENILTLHQSTADEIMTPLVNLSAIRLGQIDLAGLRKLAIESGYSRFPVYRERIVHIIGCVDIYRVLREFDGSQTLQDFIDPPHYVPETKRVDDLLQEFLEGRIKNAVVVDEFGGCSGWISREDIMEEIVGELEDELDEPVALIAETGPGSYLVEGRIEIEALNIALGTEFSDDEWETLAGLILNEMGRIPKADDEISIDGWRARIVEMEGNRIAKIEMTHLA